MGELKNDTNPGNEEISPLEELIHKKNDETKALRKLLKALEEDEIKTSHNHKTNDKWEKTTKISCILGVLLFPLTISTASFAQLPTLKANTRTTMPACFAPAKIDLTNPLSSKVYRDG